MPCSWLACQLIKTPLYKQLSHWGRSILSRSSVGCATQDPVQDSCSRAQPAWGLPPPWDAFVLMWWLAVSTNGDRKCHALHEIPSSFCFPEACLWKKPAPKAKQRRSLRFPILNPSSCSLLLWANSLNAFISLNVSLVSWVTCGDHPELVC